MGKPRAAWAALFALFACAPLPAIDVGQCGNGVIELGEDCDGFPLDSSAEPGQQPAQCRAPGAIGQCRLDCARQRDGTLPQCPLGWGCDEGGTCRPPTGDLAPLREIEVGSATTLLTGDFDGDGRADIASLAPEGASIARVRFHYFDGQAELAETRKFPLPMIFPVVADVSGDGRSDLLFSDSRIGVLRGRVDRSWVPDTFSSYSIDDTSIRTISVFPGPVENISGFVTFARLAGAASVFVANGGPNGMPQAIGDLPSLVEDLVGDPVAGRVLEDRLTYPCSQVLLAARAQSHFWMYDACTTRAGVEGPAWRTRAEQRSIELDPPAAIDVAPLLVDLNGDAHLDVLIGAGGSTYAAYGDGLGLSTAVPYVLNAANAAAPIIDLPMPLGIGDVTGDGAPDFLLDRGVVVSSPAASGSGFDYGSFTLQPPGHWTSALVANLNGNDRPDLVAASSGHPGIDFFNNTGNVNLTSFTIPTNRPVRHLVGGDFDGDGIGDVAFTELSRTLGWADSLFVSFGASAGAPQAPQAVAQVNDIEQISTFRAGSRDHILVSSRAQVGERSRGSLALLASNGDRIPVASLDLTTFAADGATISSTALRMTLGGFIEPLHRDVLVLAFQSDAFGGLNLDVGLQAWLLPALASDGTPRLLTASFDPELAPISVGNLAFPISLSVERVDIDGDGRDEAVIAMPQRDGSHCSVLLFTVESDRLEPRGSWVVDEACQRVEVRALDADADGAQDLLLLTGASDASSGSLSVFWNNGNGSFDVGRRTVLTTGAPSAFATLKATTARRLQIAYVNAEGLSLIAATEQAREFDPPSLLEAHEGCTGVVAADLNGDAATDLAYAARGNIHVLKATLEEQ